MSWLLWWKKIKWMFFESIFLKNSFKKLLSVPKWWKYPARNIHHGILCVLLFSTESLNWCASTFHWTHPITLETTTQGTANISDTQIKFKKMSIKVHQHEEFLITLFSICVMYVVHQKLHFSSTSVLEHLNCVCFFY